MAPDSFAVDHEFERYAISAGHGQVTVATLEDDRVLMRLPGRGFRCHGMHFSDDGRYLAGVYSENQRDNCLLVWDLKAGELIAPLSTRLCRGAWQFCPDSQRIAICDSSGQLRLFELPSGAPVQVLPSHHEPERVAFDASAARLAVSYQTPPVVQIIDLGANAIVGELEHPAHVRGVAWSDDGRRLAATAGNNLHVWSMPAGRELLVLRGHESTAIEVAFSHRGDLLASNGLGDSTILWDAATGEMLLRASGSYVTHFSPDDRLLSGAHGIGNRAGIWEVSEPKAYRTIRFEVDRLQYGDDWQQQGTWTLAFHPSRQVLAASALDGVRLWDLAVDPHRPAVMLPRELTSACIFLPDGSAMLQTGWTGVLAWTWADREDQDSLAFPAARQLVARELEGEREKAGEETDFSFIKIEAAALKAYEYERTLADETRQATPIPSYVGGGRRAPPDTYVGRYASLSSDGRWLGILQQQQRRADVFDLQTSRAVSLPDDVGVDFIALSPDGRWAATGTHRQEASRTRIWQRQDGRLVQELPTGDAFIYFRPDGSQFVTGSAEKYQLWESGTWSPGPTILRTGCTMRGPAAYSSNGQVLALAPSPYEVRLVDPADGREIASLAAPHHQAIVCLQFSHDGDWLAASCQGCSIQLWNLRALADKFGEMQIRAPGIH